MIEHAHYGDFAREVTQDLGYFDVCILAAITSIIGGRLRCYRVELAF